MPTKPHHAYATDPAWSDVTPIPQDDGGPNALATIAYTDEYRETTSYLRAIMASGEKSERALGLTSHVIALNPAHYTVWLYRAQLLQHLHKSALEELSWLDVISLKHVKNYQIWHHRQILLESLASELSSEPSDRQRLHEIASRSEPEFIAQMLAKDAKNYHVWSYRQWLVRRFALWEGCGEMRAVEKLLAMDVRNNSAWNHRWFLVFARQVEDQSFSVSEEVMDREMEFAKSAIKMTPQNESPWNYYRGLLRKRGAPLNEDEEVISFAKTFADPQKPDEIRSTHALDLLAEAWGGGLDPSSSTGDQRKENIQSVEIARTRKIQAGRALDLLANKFDPIRANYWNYRKSLLGLPEERMRETAAV